MTVPGQGESVAGGDLILQLLDLGADELDDPPAALANEVVVVVRPAADS